MEELKNDMILICDKDPWRRMIMVGYRNSAINRYRIDGYLSAWLVGFEGVVGAEEIEAKGEVVIVNQTCVHTHAPHLFNCSGVDWLRAVEEK